MHRLARAHGLTMIVQIVQIVQIVACPRTDGRSSFENSPFAARKQGSSYKCIAGEIFVVAPTLSRVITFT